MESIRRCAGFVDSVKERFSILASPRGDRRREESCLGWFRRTASDKDLIETKDMSMNLLDCCNWEFPVI